MTIKRKKKRSIKKTPADDWFSKCTRLRTNYVCERCNGQYDSSSSGLHASHFYGRAAHATRFHPDNIFAHCNGCHQYLGSNPPIFTAWATAKLGDGLIELLKERHRDISTAKIIKKDLKSVAKHYENEYIRMSALRASGDDGRIEFVNYL